ncbi:hypothetical protein IAG25_33060 [Caballeronia sp. EK]|uniref:hypothetical protein n=1 Tax=Caballeronia sp. EK TaxID=2767469 RepID=UPI001655088A|nr:hypothetical protein [Caballeronia sp. EK]MBC8641657.1 hypothetical protein [Caballeronia sp. EK]
MSTFKKPKRVVDREAMERFAQGADDRRAAINADPAEQPPQAPVDAASPVREDATANDVPSVVSTPSAVTASATAAPSVAVTPPVNVPEVAVVERANPAEHVAYDKHQQIQWRVSQHTRDMFERVYKNTNVKSKQQLLDSILLPALEKMDDKTR